MIVISIVVSIILTIVITIILLKVDFGKLAEKYLNRKNAQKNQANQENPNKAI